ncbi:hypothetical protein Q4Q34_07760 [Flavivirga abyssicola]|uniref:hypothetical protein n=1 Tax=Flavivirga abyssicola TaxID=3063533 RepID=UPI0026DF0D91|nr:hypothetical protein [Flavivirga sp. MEBiC07777]WVK14921.1 hypothetical protein Q4Q34_07760 [Flavivirga sp. MEBiC07777]
MRQYRKAYFIIIVVLLVIYLAYKYHNFKKYVNIYNNESSVLVERIEYYSSSRMDNVPSNKKDFDKMYEWLKNIEETKNILEYGINFKYDSLDKSLSVYSFGIDRGDDNLKKPYYSASASNEYSIFGANDIIKSWNFYDVFNTKGKDVLLFKLFLNEDYLCRNFVQNERYLREELSIPYAQAYVFYQGNQRVSKELEKQLKEKVRPYKYLIAPSISKLNDNTKISFIRYKDGKFVSVCSDNININIFDTSLKETLINNKVDYAIIPILIDETDELK